MRPLGAGALAGSSLPLDPEGVAASSDSTSSFSNSLDAVSDRDFACDLAYACALGLVHLSRLGEELVLWTSAEFGWAELDDARRDRVDMMPQKKNPDVGELVRGRAGTAIGRLAGLLATLKGLPLAYNRDLQEDKEPVFAQADAYAGALDVLALACAGPALRRRRAWPPRPTTACRVATDVAEALVREGVPFREAHERVARRIAAGERFASPTAAEAIAARSGPGMPGPLARAARGAAAAASRRRPGRDRALPAAPPRRRAGA